MSQNEMIYGTLILNGDKFDLLTEQAHDELSTAHNFAVYFNLVLADMYAKSGSYADVLGEIGKQMDLSVSVGLAIAADGSSSPLWLLMGEIEAYSVDDSEAHYV